MHVASLRTTVCHHFGWAFGPAESGAAAVSARKRTGTTPCRVDHQHLCVCQHPCAPGRRPAPPVRAASCVRVTSTCFACCLNRRPRRARWNPTVGAVGCYRPRSGMSQTALVRRRCASCRCGLPPSLPSSLRPSAPPSLAPSVPPPPTTASPVAPPLLQRCGCGRAGQTCDVHEDISHMRGRRPVLLLDASARDRAETTHESESARTRQGIN